jgi:hypothetical protein
MQLCHGLAADTISTFPVRLLFSEMNYSTGQSSFLKYPTALVKWRLLNIFFEIINGFGYGQISYRIQFDFDINRWHSIAEEAFGGRRGGEGTIGMAIVSLHLLAL